MDPISAIGFAASIAQLLNTTVVAIQYINNVQDAPKERSRLALEISSLLTFLTNLRYRVEEIETRGEWLANANALAVPNGPLDQVRCAVEEVIDKLKPAEGLAKSLKRLKWPFEKQDVAHFLGQIERAKALIGLALQNDHFELSRAIKEDLFKMSSNVVDLANGVDLIRLGHEDGERTTVNDWLSPLDFSFKQQDTYNSHEDGTGSWFLKSDEFIKWRDGDGSTLWCPGLPGAGKTVLASIVIDHLKKMVQGSDIMVMYVYCSYQDQITQTTINLVASLLRQVVQSMDSMPGNVISVFHALSYKNLRPSLPDVVKLLRSCLLDFSSTFVVVDALDEISGAAGNRERLLEVIDSLDSDIKVMVTSRNTPISNSKGRNITSLEIRASNEDIGRYVDRRLEDGSFLARHVKADPGLRQEIVRTTVENAKGMFLLAQLHVDSLAGQPTRKQLRSSLKRLPVELDSIYDECMHRICTQDESLATLAKHALAWISNARRPLTIQELRYALAIEPCTSELDEEALLDVDLLTSMCAGLVTIDEESKVVRLIHYTTQKYFDRTQTKWFPLIHSELATACLTYLLYDVLDVGPAPSKHELQSRFEVHPLLHYSAQNWGWHARGLPEEDTTVQHLTFRLFEQGSRLQAFLQVFYLQGRFPEDSSGLQIASIFGLKKIAQLLIWKGVDIDSVNCKGNTALHEAAAHGHYELITLLLNNGADINAANKIGVTPLHSTALKGHETAMKVLLESGANTEVKSNYEKTALHCAALWGTILMCQLLLDHGADLEALGRNGETALHIAVSNGREEVKTFLLSMGANAEAVDNTGYTLDTLERKYNHAADVYPYGW